MTISKENCARFELFLEVINAPYIYCVVVGVIVNQRMGGTLLLHIKPFFCFFTFMQKSYKRESNFILLLKAGSLLV